MASFPQTAGYCWRTSGRTSSGGSIIDYPISRHPTNHQEVCYVAQTLSYPVCPRETACGGAAFPHGSPYLTFRDALGTIFQDEDFAALFPAWGQPGLPPWRLALITIMQFREQLSDRQAAEAVRARIDWKYLLGLELSDPGVDFSVPVSFGTACSPAVRKSSCWTNSWSDAVL